MTDQRRFVIVGAGLAGAKAAEALRERGFEGPSCSSATEPHLPYERPPLSKGYLQTGERLDEAFVHHAEWYAEHDVELRIGPTVTAIDRDARGRHSRRRADGIRPAAAGHRRSPRHLTVPGADLGGVLLRCAPRGQRPDPRGPAARRAAGRVVGARLDRARGGRGGAEAGGEVTVLEALDAAAAAGARARDRRGVRRPAPRARRRPAHRRSPVDGDRGRRTAPSSGVRLADGSGRAGGRRGRRHRRRPERRAGRGGRPGGRQRRRGRRRSCAPATPTSARPATSPASSTRCSGSRVRVEHWANALNQPAGRGRGDARPGRPRPELPYFFTDQYDLGMEYTGLRRARRDDEVVVRGDLAGREFVAFWLRDGRVLAGMNVNVWDVPTPPGADPLRRKVVDRDQLADPEVNAARTTDLT